MSIFQVWQLLIMHCSHYVLQLNTNAWLRGAPEKPISDNLWSDSAIYSTIQVHDNFKVDETNFVAAQGLAQCQIETGDFR